MIVVTGHCCVREDLEYWPNATTEEQIPADWRRRMLWFQISTPETQVGLNEIRNLTGEKESNEELKDVLPALSNSSERLEERSKVLMNSVVRSANCLRSPTVWPLELRLSESYSRWKRPILGEGKREEQREGKAAEWVQWKIELVFSSRELTQNLVQILIFIWNCLVPGILRRWHDVMCLEIWVVGWEEKMDGFVDSKREPCSEAIRFLKNRHAAINGSTKDEKLRKKSSEMKCDSRNEEGERVGRLFNILEWKWVERYRTSREQELNHRNASKAGRNSKRRDSEERNCESLGTLWLYVWKKESHVSTIEQGHRHKDHPSPSLFCKQVLTGSSRRKL